MNATKVIQWREHGADCQTCRLGIHNMLKHIVEMVIRSTEKVTACNKVQVCLTYISRHYKLVYIIHYTCR